MKLSKRQLQMSARRLVALATSREFHTFYNAKKEMDVAEVCLVSTFDEKQRALYEEFCKKRELFYESADKLYVERF